MRTRVLGAVVLASLILGGQGTALAATPDVNAAVCSLSQGNTPLLVPPAEVDTPVIKTVYRNTAGDRATWETASATTDGRYWTRAGGNDVVIELANPFSGYTLNVYKNNKVIHSEAVDACDPFVTVPLAVDEGEYSRTFRFTADGATGPAASAAFGVDRTAPVISTVTRIGPGTTDVALSESIVAGTDSFQNWFVRSSMTVDQQTHVVRTNVTSVSVVDTRTRRLTHDPIGDVAFLGVDYALLNGERYTDVAGNGLADTFPWTTF